MVASKSKSRKSRAKVRTLPVKSRGSKSVKGGMRKAGGDANTSGKEFLRYKFDTVFTTKID